MIYTLENVALHLEVKPLIARWSLFSHQHNGPALTDLQIGVRYNRGYARHYALDRWLSATAFGPETVASPHGNLNQLRFDFVSERDDLHYSLKFALLNEAPILLWKLTIKNKGRNPVFIDQIDLLSAGFIYKERSGQAGVIQLSQGLERASRSKPGQRPRTPVADLAFFSNGWQSWSYSGVYAPDDHYRRTRLGPLRSMTNVNSGTPQPRRMGLFASDMFGVLGDRRQRMAILAGFLSQKNQFGSLETYIGASPPALHLWANGDGARLDPGYSMTTDWACLSFLHLDAADSMGPYLEAVAREHGLPQTNRRLATPPTGWCSWYQFSTEDYVGKLTAQDVRENLAAIAYRRPGLPLEVIQIDDGYEAQVGDWFSFNPGFPEGVAPLAAEIRQAGFTPGLWLAPFIVHPKSRLATDHPDWLLRGRWGRPTNAGLLWGTLTNALDLTHPDAQGYTQDVIRTVVHEWGFSYLKLDFLYAAALPGGHRDPTRTRAQVLRSALEMIRAAAGEETILLGCGSPLGPAIGLVDSMRIGADTARRWNPSIKGIEFFFKHEPNLPAAGNASHNALTRAALHCRWWVNDPDCLLLRPGTHLTLAEVQTQATIAALTGGSLLLSDHLPDLPPERLRIAQSLLPLIGQRPHVLDWFDAATPQRVQLTLDGPIGRWHLLALFNWENQSQDIPLHLSDFYLDPQVEYYVREFWRGETSRISMKGASGGECILKQIPAHGAALLALRPCRPYTPQYLGSDLHISQGLEVIDWSVSANELHLRLERPGFTQGFIELALPRTPQEAFQEEKFVTWQSSGEGRYSFAVNFEKLTDIRIRY